VWVIFSSIHSIFQNSSIFNGRRRLLLLLLLLLLLPTVISFPVHFLYSL